MKAIAKRGVSIALIFALITCSFSTSAWAAGNSVVTVDWNKTYQEIDGFGFTQEEECTYVMEEPYRSEVMDLLFDQEKGIGCSILRTEIGCGESKPTIEPEPGVWDRSGDPRELWYFREALSRGVDKIYGTVWSPPKWMKTNNDWNHGGWVKKQYYQDFADYLAQYVKIYRDEFGIDMYGISPANEPEYPAQWKSCLWSSTQMKDFVENYLYPAFEQEGLSTKIMVGESGFWSDALAKPLLRDSETRHMVDIVTAHQYQGLIIDLPTARENGKHLWLSELCDTTGDYHVEIDDAVGWGKIIHEFMTIPQANAFLYWRGSHATDSNQTLIRLDSNTSYTVPKRLYALGHFSKFVRPGWVRIDATDKAYKDLRVSAYKDPDTGEFAVVIINDDRNNNRVVDFVFEGFTAGYVTPYLTDLDYNMEELEAVPVQNGRFTLSVGAESMITLAGTAGSAPIAQKAYTITDPLNNLDLIHDRTDGWMIETGNGYGRYDNSGSCLRRTEITPQNVTYSFDYLDDFLATIHFCDDISGITFYTSQDGNSFELLETAHTKPVATTKDWHRVQFSPENGIPQGTRFLMIEFSGGADCWNKHLSEISFSGQIASSETPLAHLPAQTDNFHDGENMASSDLQFIYNESYPIENGGFVFHTGDATNSTHFRIPFLWNTTQGNLIAGVDANFGSGGDSAENIDIAVRLKPNAATAAAMEGWLNAVIPDAMHMLDYADEDGYKQKSASFIDAVILQDSLGSGRILLLADAWAWNGGLFEHLNDESGSTRTRAVARGDGFCTIDGKKYLLLSSQNIKGNGDGQTGNINNNTNRSKFNYAADIYGSPNEAGLYPIYHLNGTPRAYSLIASRNVDDSNLSLGAESEYALNRDYELYKNGEMLFTPQKSSDLLHSDKMVPVKIFYEDSELQMYNTSYIMQFYSEDEGATWHTDKIVSGMFKRENSKYYILGPGRGLQIQNGKYAGRLIVPVYYQGSPNAEVIFSDDGGETWQHGDSVPSIYGLSEAAPVEMPDGSLKLFLRNTSSFGGTVIEASSTDGGESWRDVKCTFNNNSAGINCQMSAIQVSKPVVSRKDGREYPAILLSCANLKNRTHGRLFVGLLKEDGTYPNGDSKYHVDWEYQYDVTPTDSLYAYSCLSELEDGRIALIYESSPNNSWDDGLQMTYYQEFELDALLN